MAEWNDSVVENGVEVTYSSDCELFLMDTETGEYDAKIDVYSNHIETYVSKDSYWEEHDHYHTDDEGNTKEVHGMETREWKDTCRS